MSSKTIAEESLALHESLRGKIEVVPRVKIETMRDLSLAYTPGVAAACLEIQKDVSLSYKYTRRSNLVLVVTDGTAVLGLGDIGPEAGMPVMEGKCVLFKAFADVDAFPLCVRSKDVDEIVRTVSLIAGSFGGINLEDISAPRCFEVERRLKEVCDIPVVHDDQHGTAIVVSAALINALKVVGKNLASVRVTINGAGAAGTSICRMLQSLGVSDVVMCDRDGALYQGKPNMTAAHTELAGTTNPRGIQGTIADALVEADVFIGVSAPRVVSGEMVRRMNKGAIVFAMANPTPEIFPEEAKAAGAAVVGTGRSDYPNQINNVLAFPGIFRGALDVRASDITEAMKQAAAYAIADFVGGRLSREFVVPRPFDEGLGAAVGRAVAKAAQAERN
ncbi:MAG: NAD-dependent malic enzyme [Oscillospiraceae bacterium]|jgi:malate dehydrogenase (oxaloacetate-decarboxylating)|nr:NAD-dependent malic enzyme [Oscillospiraceae bacterium]